MITGLQIVAIVFSLIMVYLAYLHYQRKEIGKIEFMSWWLIWSAAVIIIIFPELLRGFAGTFLITRVFDFMVIGGFILVITLSYQSYVKNKALERKIEKLVRELSLKEKNESRK